jgi:hypothetical protein
MRSARRRWANLYYRYRTLLCWSGDHVRNIRRNKMVSRNRVTSEILRRLGDSIPLQFKTPDGQTEALSLASGVLRVFLRSEWVEKHVISDDSKKGFLSIRDDDPVKREISFFRVMDLAEILFNLQRVPGFDECLDRMRRGDIEGALAEFNIGRMLFLNKVPFRFVIPQGVKKKDYDFDILCPNGQAACADAKCKIDETTFSEGGIKEALKKARGQLPNEKPGIIFVKVPEHYLSDPLFQMQSIQIAERFLGGVTRIASVKYYVEPIQFANNVMRIELAYKELSNPRTDFGDGVDWNLFRKHHLPPEANGMPPHYKRIILSRFKMRPPNE